MKKISESQKEFLKKIVLEIEKISAELDCAVDDIVEEEAQNREFATLLGDMHLAYIKSLSYLCKADVVADYLLQCE